MTYGPITVNRPGVNATVAVRGPEGAAGNDGLPGASGQQGPAVFLPLAAWVGGTPYQAGSATIAASFVSVAAAPLAADIQLIDPQAEGAATLAAQLAGNASLATMATALGNILTAVSTDHADLQALLAGIGTPGDAATVSSQIGLLKKLVALLSAALAITGTVTANIGTTNGLALDASVQSLVSVLGAKGDAANLTSLMGLTAAIKASLAGTLTTKPATPTPIASAGYVTALLARTGAGAAVNIQASNANQTVEGYVVACDLAAVPAPNTAITPLKVRRLLTNDQTIDGLSEIDTPFAVANGLVVLLTTSLTQYVPGALSGVINASYL